MAHTAYFYPKKLKNRWNLTIPAVYGCGGRTRTYGLRVMSPTSCQLLHAAISTCFPSMVPVTGLEPVRYRYRGILSPLCLPIPPHRRISAIDRIPYTHPDVNSFLQTKIFSLTGIFQAVPHRLVCLLLCREQGETLLPAPYGSNQARKEVQQMDTVYPHGDVDDMIYQEEWSASTR